MKPFLDSSDISIDVLLNIKDGNQASALLIHDKHHGMNMKL